MKPVVLWFDPPNAWALVQGEELLAHGHWSKAKKDDCYLVQRVKDVLDSLPVRPDVLGIEGQYLHVYGDDAPHVKRGKQRGSLVLSFRAGLIAGVCMARTGLPCRKQDPDGWQRTMVGGGDREQRKKMSLLKARAMTGVKLTEDESDAYLMAVYEGLRRKTEG